MSAAHPSCRSRLDSKTLKKTPRRMDKEFFPPPLNATGDRNTSFTLFAEPDRATTSASTNAEADRCSCRGGARAGFPYRAKPARGGDFVVGIGGGTG